LLILANSVIRHTQASTGVNCRSDTGPEKSASKVAVRDESKKKRTPRRLNHTIPARVPDATVAKLVVASAPEHEVRDIREYVEIQARPEKVIRLEKIKTEHVFNRRYAAWDVRTNRDRYWVITDPTNLSYAGHWRRCSVRSKNRNLF